MNEIKELLSLGILPLLYAEIHTRLPFIPNILDNKLPEIIADAPSRIDSKEKLPLLILIKDSHLYPVELHSIKAELRKDGKKIQVAELCREKTRIAQRIWHKIFELEADVEGWAEIDVFFEIRRGKKLLHLKNNSYRLSKKKSLRVYISSHRLPDRERIIYGDTHSHSFSTEDFVEFGAPVGAMARMARAMGLSFFAVTDHSYDLDDEEGKWERFLEECQAVKETDITVLPGIEVSAGNIKGKNVHLLILNPQHFYPGKGDSAELWLKNKPDHPVAKIIAGLGKDELPLAAHPFHRFSILQKFFLRRGAWSLEDILGERLTGLQIFNGLFDRNLRRGIKKWVDILLSGQKKFIHAGNDSHGSFNRLLQIKLPFLLLREKKYQIFGWMKTGIYLDKHQDIQEILSRLKKGRSFVTTGPSIYYYLYNQNRKYFPGDEARSDNLKLFLEIHSIKEFGPIQTVSVILGDLVAKKETEHSERVDDWKYSFDGKLPFPILPDPYYVRITCQTAEGLAFSNPVWVVRQKKSLFPPPNSPGKGRE